jgi:predicted Asp-tRNA(Asn)/Glu-tRNA(Gln) amidotransferase subunit C
MVDKEEIRIEAKQIMDNFMRALENVDVEEEFVLYRDSCMREEGEENLCDDEFRERFLGNAPKISGSSIVANKGNWTK